MYDEGEKEREREGLNMKEATAYSRGEQSEAFA